MGFRKKVVCSTAVIFGAMEVSQGMEAIVWKKIQLKTNKGLKNADWASKRAAFVCPDVMKHFVIKNGQICNVNGENEVLRFSEIDLIKKCTTAEFKKEKSETQKL